MANETRIELSAVSGKPTRWRQYLSRLFQWQLRDNVHVYDSEHDYIDKHLAKIIARDDDDAAETFRKYVVWRQTLLIAVMPLLLIAIGISSNKVLKEFEYFSDLERDDDRYYGVNVKPIAHVAVVSGELMNEVIVFIGVLASYWFRYNFQRSTNILLVAVTISMVAQLWPSLLQADAQFDLQDHANEQVALIRISDTLRHAIALIPIVIAFPRGATNAAFIAFGLVPEGVTARILIVYFQPLFTFILILGASPLTQLAGDSILAASLLCFFLSDACIYLSLGHIKSKDVEALTTGYKARFRLVLKIIALILIVAWLLLKVLGCDFSGNSDSSQDRVSAEESTCYAMELLNFSKVYFANLAVNFLRNLWISKLLFTDTITRTMSNYETGVEALKYFRDDAMQDEIDSDTGKGEGGEEP